ncbi:MAG: DsbA family protein [Oceanicaulis sp.]
MRIDVFYDVLCPFCFLAKRSLDLAMAETGAAPQIVHHPFMLHPEFPRGPHDFQQAFTAKYGEAARGPMWDSVIARGREVGIAFAFYDIKHGFNSITAHRLVHKARAIGVEAAVLEDLYSAFFEDGLYLGDTTLLAHIGARHGLPEADTRAYLDSDQEEAEIFALTERFKRDPGVTGMPYHLVDGAPFRLAKTGVGSFRALLKTAAPAAG